MSDAMTPETLEYWAGKVETTIEGHVTLMALADAWQSDIARAQKAERLADVRKRLVSFLSVYVSEEMDMGREERAQWAQLEDEERAIS